VPEIKKETGSGSHIWVKGGNCPLNFFDCFELFLNNRHWFDCFELIKSYIISNWIGYDMELNTFTRWTSKHFNCCQWVKIDICKIKGWFFLKKKKRKKLIFYFWKWFIMISLNYQSWFIYMHYVQHATW
jgi:hypothetical protein